MANTTQKVARKSVALAQAYRAVFSGPAGEMVLLDLMQRHGMLSNTYNGNVNDMLLKEGERLVVLRILKTININVQELRERIEQNEKALAE